MVWVEIFLWETVNRLLKIGELNPDKLAGNRICGLSSPHMINQFDLLWVQRD